MAIKVIIPEEIKHNITQKQIDLVAEQCEKFIDVSPTWNGGATYRGLAVTDSLIEQWKGIVGKETTIDMRGTSSWSTDVNIGTQYASKWVSKENPRKALFICEGEQYGTSIQHIAKYPQEKEVLCSNKSKWIISSYEEINGFVIFTVRLAI